MTKGELKTKVSDQPVSDFIKEVDASRQEETQILLNLFANITEEEPKLWKDMIGYGLANSPFVRLSLRIADRSTMS